MPLGEKLTQALTGVGSGHSPEQFILPIDTVGRSVADYQREHFSIDVHDYWGRSGANTGCQFEGLGLDQRLHGLSVTGSGLMLDDELLQLSAFSRSGQNDHSDFGDVIIPTRETRITRPSRRRN